MTTRPTPTPVYAGRYRLTGDDPFPAHPVRPRSDLLPYGDCPVCDQRHLARTATLDGSDFGPAHDASRSCQSGGYSHCTCDTCF